MMDMVERVARAIAAENGDDFAALPDSKADWIAAGGSFGGRFRDINEPRKSDYLEMARAAIEAMREPNEAMLEAGEKIVDPHDASVERGYAAMIDAALAPSPPLGEE